MPAVTGSPIVAFNTARTVTLVAATSSVINEVETFTVTPTKTNVKGVVEIYNGTGHGAITYSLPAGDHYGAGTAMTGSVAAGVRVALEIESGKYMTDGKYVITLTPATGKRLATDHAAGMTFIELL